MFNTILTEDHVVLGAKVGTKEEAIQLAGKVLVEKGCITEGYISKMMDREMITSTYMGNFIAIPHGTEDAKSMVQHPGISVIQVPNGVDYGNGNIAKIVIGIAGKNNEHLEMLSKIAIICSDEDNVQKLIASTSKEEMLSIFEGVN